MYKKKGAGWIGYCDSCELPLQPAYIETRVKHKKKDSVFGFCIGCKKKGQMLMDIFEKTSSSMKTTARIAGFAKELNF